jgi:hypothetical protein
MAEDEKTQIRGEEKVQIREVPRAGTPKVKWDTANMRSDYANVCNANCTREEVVLLFGQNKAWSGMEEEVTVQINERIILSPFAAKRLSLLLNGVLQQYEERFGALDITTQAQAPAKAQAPAPAPKGH